jgi:hypothetical protein
MDHSHRRRRAGSIAYRTGGGKPYQPADVNCFKKLIAKISIGVILPSYQIEAWKIGQALKDILFAPGVKLSMVFR